MTQENAKLYAEYINFLYRGRGPFVAQARFSEFSKRYVIKVFNPVVLCATLHNRKDVNDFLFNSFIGLS